MDLVIGVPALIVLSPVFALVAIIVRLDSRGPVLFRQTRVGMRGRSFAMWKFRTMVRDAPDELHRDLVLPLIRGCTDEPPEPEAASVRGSTSSQMTRALPAPVGGCAKPRWTSCRSCSTSSAAR